MPGRGGMVDRRSSLPGTADLQLYPQMSLQSLPEYGRPMRQYHPIPPPPLHHSGGGGGGGGGGGLMYGSGYSSTGSHGGMPLSAPASMVNPNPFHVPQFNPQQPSNHSSHSSYSSRGGGGQHYYNDGTIGGGGSA